MDLFDEYKFFADSTQRLSERRLAASGTFISVNTIIFGVLSFVITNAAKTGWGRLALSLPLFVVGALVCVLWHRTLTQYRALISWRYDELMALERHEQLRESHHFYLKEYERFYRHPPKHEHFGFSRVEVWLPRSFLLVYAAYLVGLVIVVAQT